MEYIDASNKVLQGEGIKINYFGMPLDFVSQQMCGTRLQDSANIYLLNEKRTWPYFPCELLLSVQCINIIFARNNFLCQIQWIFSLNPNFTLSFHTATKM